MTDPKPINRIITGQYPVVGTRRAKMVDIPAIQHLIEQSLHASGEGHYTPRQLESALHSIGRVDEHLIEAGTLYIATSGGEVVGVGGWSSRNARYPGDQSAAVASEKVDPATTPAYLRCYYVGPHWTRMAVASGLLEDSIAAAKQAGFKQVEVLCTPMSLPFFQARGFETQEEMTIPVDGHSPLPVTRLTKAIE